jgi:hypothetical protein
MFGNNMLKKIFGPLRGEVNEQLMVLYNEELHSSCSSLNILRILKSRGLQWTGHVARVAGDKRLHTEFLWGNLLENLEASERRGMITLILILGR